MTQDQGHVPQPAAPTQPQRMIAGRYTVISEIGRGGMGIVWLAEDRMIGRRVAIKELHLPDGVPVEERAVFEERVLREARTAGRLNDPAVVTVYDVVQESGNTYIVMELIQAPTLSELVRRGGPMPQDAVAALAGQLLSALEAAHAAGIVHRDVKPSNVMVLPNGRVKLTDFGIAQSLDDPRLTTSGVLIGSPNYMAPERISGAEADAASDLWSLGTVLFVAVEGYSPFERASTAATMHAIMTEVPYLTRCQGPLASVVMGLLIGNPQARLTAHQVRALLSQVNAPQPTGTRTTHLPPPGHTRQVTGPQRPPARSARRWLLAGAAVVAAAALFAAGYLLRPVIGTGGPAANPADGGVLTYGTGGDIPEFDVSVGYCAVAELRAGVSVPSTSDCAKAHSVQVFGSNTVVRDSGDLSVGYPGTEALSDYGRSWCALVFASDLVASQDKASALSFVTLLPSEALWKDTELSGNRDVICVARSRDGSQLRQSVLPDN